jgi:hypothetical protein
MWAFCGASSHWFFSSMLSDGLSSLKEAGVGWDFNLVVGL